MPPSSLLIPSSLKGEPGEDEDLPGVLPQGGVDALRQVSLFVAAYLAYRLVRGVVEGSAGAAFAHARDLISLERGLHLFVEPSIQAWASGSHVVMVSASWLYVNAQT